MFEGFVSHSLFCTLRLSRYKIDYFAISYSAKLNSDLGWKTFPNDFDFIVRSKRHSILYT